MLALGNLRGAHGHAVEPQGDAVAKLETRRITGLDAAVAGAPEAPRALLPRQRTASNSERSSSVNAVILGLAAVPAVLMAFGSATPVDAQSFASRTGQLPGSADAAELARAELFAARAQTEDPHVTELKQKVGHLVDTRFGGDVEAAFRHYAGGDGRVSRDELSRLLADADIGNFLTRGAWVSGIMERVDTNRDGKISWPEFQTVMAPAPQAA